MFMDIIQQKLQTLQVSRIYRAAEPKPVLMSADELPESRAEKAVHLQLIGKRFFQTEPVHLAENIQEIRVAVFRAHGNRRQLR